MRYLIVSASMGAGHDGAARELAGRLSRAGHHAEVADLIGFLPFRLGAMLRAFYSGMLRYAPWLYELTYRLFFVPRRVGPSASPLVLLTLRRLRRTIANHRPDTVVSTFHLAAQAVGELRQRDQLRAPAAVLLVDFAVHRLWLHPGNDLYLCTHPAAAHAVRSGVNRPARATGPAVSWRFHSPGNAWAVGPSDTSPVSVADTAAGPAATTGTPARADTVADGRVLRERLIRQRLGLPEDGRLVVVAGGAWGTGHGVTSAARTLADSDRFTPVVLCGRNDRLRRELAALPGVIALGWVEDMPLLFAAACALVENGGGGLTCAEAFAAGLPVVTYRPLPGHGRAGARELAAAGLAALARNERELLSTLDVLSVPGERRNAQVAAAKGLFTADPAVAIADLVRTADNLQPDRPVETHSVAREV